MFRWDIVHPVLFRYYVSRYGRVKLEARDSEGRTRREESLSSVGPWSTDGKARTMVFINDPVAQTQYVLDPSNRSANKMAARSVQCLSNIRQISTASIMWANDHNGYMPAGAGFAAYRWDPLTKSIQTALGTDTSPERKDIDKAVGTINWTETLIVTCSFIALMLGLSCWRFAIKDY